MFKLKLEKGTYTLYDKPSNTVVKSLNLTNVFFIIEATIKMRDSITKGENMDLKTIDKSYTGREAGKTMQLVATLVQQGLINEQKDNNLEE